jgi:hypothetical protein
MAKPYYAIRDTVSGKFFAGYFTDKTEIFREKRYWLYDKTVGEKKMATMASSSLELIESPCQDETQWDAR